jgi:hypothetical protein
VVLVTTRWGIGTSPDSIAYLHAARTIAAGGGEPVLVQHAPLYALLLGAGGSLGLEPMDGARWLNAVLFAANIVLVAAILRAVVRHQPWLAFTGGLLAAALAPMLASHVMALSEPVFLTCTLGGCWLLARYLDAPTPGRVVAAAAVVSLALLARYAGAAVVLAGALAIVVWGRARWTTRLAHAALFGCIAALPIGVWILRNVAAGGGATGRDLAFHPVGLSHAWEALFTGSSWLLIPSSAPNAVRFAAWGAVLGLLAFAAKALQLRREPVPSLVRVLALFVGTYGAFLVTSISLLDANTPLDDRILLPALAAGLVVGLFAMDAIWPAARQRRSAMVGLTAALILFTAGHAVKAATLATTGYERGWGFSSRAWRESPTIAAARALPAGRDVYSNAPEILYLHTGQRARNIPRARFLMNQQMNPAFAAELDAVGRDMQARCGAMVYFRSLTQKAMPSEQQIRQSLPLVVWAEMPDGVILGAAACRP